MELHLMRIHRMDWRVVRHREQAERTENFIYALFTQFAPVKIASAKRQIHSKYTKFCALAVQAPSFYVNLVVCMIQPYSFRTVENRN